MLRSARARRRPSRLRPRRARLPDRGGHRPRGRRARSGGVGAPELETSSARCGWSATACCSCWRGSCCCASARTPPPTGSPSAARPGCSRPWAPAPWRGPATRRRSSRRASRPRSSTRSTSSRPAPGSARSCRWPLLLARRVRRVGRGRAAVRGARGARLLAGGARRDAGVVATGAANAWFQVGSVPALVGTRYGWLLLAKVALLVPVLVLAGRNRRRLLPALSGDGATVGRPAMARLGRFVAGERASAARSSRSPPASRVAAPPRHDATGWPLSLPLLLGRDGGGARGARALPHRRAGRLRRPARGDRRAAPATWRVLLWPRRVAASSPGSGSRCRPCRWTPIPPPTGARRCRTRRCRSRTAPRSTARTARPATARPAAATAPAARACRSRPPT